MSPGTFRTCQSDLVVLTADKNAQFAIRGILSRHLSLEISPLPDKSVDYLIHPERDPGVLRTASQLLRPYASTHGRALVVMDREGSGCEELTAEEIESRVEAALIQNGWQSGRTSVIAVDPELETWVWTGSPQVEIQLGWSGQPVDLRGWLVQRGLLAEAEVKPARPKEALEAALRHVGTPRSSALYKALAEHVSLAQCTDRGFLKLKAALRSWFQRTRNGPR